MDKTLSFYKEIQKLAEQKGVSIVEMSNDLHISQSTARKWRDHKPTFKTIAKLADYFGVSADYLVNIGNENRQDMELENALTAFDERTEEIIHLLAALPDQVKDGVKDSIIAQLKLILSRG